MQNFKGCIGVTKSLARTKKIKYLFIEDPHGNLTQIGMWLWSFGVSLRRERFCQRSFRAIKSHCFSWHCTCRKLIRPPREHRSLSVCSTAALYCCRRWLSEHFLPHTGRNPLLMWHHIRGALPRFLSPRMSSNQSPTAVRAPGRRSKLIICANNEMASF